jgi:hypothetical protein
VLELDENGGSATLGLNSSAQDKPIRSYTC